MADTSPIDGDTPSHVYDDFNFARLSGKVLFSFGALICGLWLLLAWYDLSTAIGLDIVTWLFVAGGPGLCAFGYWGSQLKDSKTPRLSVDESVLTLRPDGRRTQNVIIRLSELTKITCNRNRGQRLEFFTETARYRLTTQFTDATPDDIARLIAIRLENIGHYLAPADRVAPHFPPVTWDVAKGNPYAEAKKTA